MSGHSKWHNIQKTKARLTPSAPPPSPRSLRRSSWPSSRAAAATPPNNSRLATVVAKAKAANMPNDNIKRTIDKALGSGNTDNYESVTYEGYGPCGVAVIVEALTDNRQRTAPEIATTLTKFGKGMGAQGASAGRSTARASSSSTTRTETTTRDAVMMDALDAGADDFNAEDNVFEITTDPDVSTMSSRPSRRRTTPSSARTSALSRRPT